MTRKEAFEFYIKLRDSGQLEEYATKGWENMTPEEQELYDFNDHQVFFNKSAGVIDYYNNPFFKMPRMNGKLFRSILGVDSKRTLDDLTDEERKGLGID